MPIYRCLTSFPPLRVAPHSRTRPRLCLHCTYSPLLCRSTLHSFKLFFNLLSVHLLCLYILRFALATLPTRRGLSYPVLAVISIILTPAHIVDIVFLSPPCHPHRHLPGRSFLAHFYSGETRPSASAGNDVGVQTSPPKMKPKFLVFKSHSVGPLSVISAFISA